MVRGQFSLYQYCQTYLTFNIITEMYLIQIFMLIILIILNKQRTLCTLSLFKVKLKYITNNKKKFLLTFVGLSRSSSIDLCMYSLRD